MARKRKTDEKELEEAVQAAKREEDRLEVEKFGRSLLDEY